VVKEVSNAYFLVLVAKENLDLLDKSYGTLNQNLLETQALLKEGFVEETDVDQLNLLLSDIETKKIESKNQYDIALKMLQLSMGLDVDKTVVLLDNLNSVLNLINLAQLEQSTFNALNNPDFKVLQVQEELLKLDVRRYKMERLPSLGAFYQMSAQAYQVKYDFYRNADWLSSQTAGIQLKLPVFSSGMQGAKIAQAQIQLDKLRNSKSFIEKSLEIQFNNTKNTLQTKQQIFMNAQKNMVLAEKINNKTILKNKEGVASSFDILQSKNQLTEAQAKYIQSLFELLNTKAELDQIQYKEAE
jgi:outer membrane protein TolC